MGNHAYTALEWLLLSKYLLYQDSTWKRLPVVISISVPNGGITECLSYQKLPAIQGWLDRVPALQELTICYHFWSTCSVPRTIQNALRVWFLLLTHQRHGPGILSPIIQSKKLGHRRVCGFIITKQLRCNAEKLSPVGLPSKPYFH